MQPVLAPSAVAIAIALVMASIAAITDFRTGLIPNAVVACGAAAGLVAQLLLAFTGHVELGVALKELGLGLLAGGVAPLVLYCCGALGGGDVKLFAALGLCLGPVPVLGVMFWSHLIALSFVPVALARSGRGLSALRTSLAIFRNMVVPAARRTPVDRTRFTALRFAPAIFVAVIWVCVLGEGQL